MALGQHFAVWSESSNCKDAFMAVTATIPRQRTELLTSWVGALIAFLSNRFPRLSATGCALYGASLFFVCAKKSKQKKAPPGIRVSLRSTPLPPVPLRGPAYKGHSWPFKPFAASMRLTPLRNTYARPSDGESARLMISSANPHGAVGKPRLSEGKTRAVRAVIPRADGNHELQSPQQTLYRKTKDRAEIRSRQEAEWNRCVRG